MNKEVYYIFGNGSRSKTLRSYLELLYPEKTLLSYLVDEMYDNAPSDKESEIRRLDVAGAGGLCKTAPVFLAVKGIYHEKVLKELKGLGFQTVIPVTPKLDNELRNAYVRSSFSAAKRDFIKIEELTMPESAVKSGTAPAGGQLLNKNCQEWESARVYVANSIYDKPLQQEYSYSEYEKPIQVGVALTEKRICEGFFTDSTGDNISEKNRQYCELTAVYWIWKHATEDVVGLAHYRRHFILPPDWQRKMAYHGVDVILPVPACAAPNIEQNYRERHDSADWDYFMAYLANYDPKAYETGKKVFAGNLYFPCNMFIMRREILHTLCAWMFPILDAVTLHCGSKEDVYQNRYPGFLSERLLTLFFEINKGNYKILFADKNFLS